MLTIMLGYLFRRVGFFTEHFLSVGYRFSFRVALPCMLFCSVYTISGFDAIDFRTVLYAVVAVVVLFLLGTAAALVLIPDRAQRGVVVQSFFRSNSAIVGISLTASLGGTEAVQCMAVITAFTIPLFNVLAVIALTVFKDEGGEGKRGLRSVNFKKIGLNILKNPLIIAIFAGLLCVLLRRLLPQTPTGEPVFLLSRQLRVIYAVIESLGEIATPFMLLMLGGQFTFTATKGMKKQILVGTVGRILLAPVLAIGVGALLSRLGVLDLGHAEYASFIALFASPIAVSSAIMAREMGNDSELAGQLVVFTSVGSTLTLFLFSFVFRLLHLL